MFIVPIGGLQPMQSMEALSETGKSASQAVSGLPFSDVLHSAINELEQAQKQSAEDSYNLAMGNTDNLVDIMINSQRLSAAVEMTTQLTSRVVSTYKEIMQMQV